MLSPGAEELVRALTRWARQVAERDSRLYSARSSLAAAIEALEQGVIGTGCSGTKGTWRPEREVPRIRPVDDSPRGRYACLSAPSRRCVAAIVEDGGGLEPRTIVYGAHSVICS